MAIVYLGIDLAKSVFALHGVDEGGKPALVLTGKGKKTLAAEGDSLPENTQVFDNLLAFLDLTFNT